MKNEVHDFHMFDVLSLIDYFHGYAIHMMLVHSHFFCFLMTMFS